MSDNNNEEKIQEEFKRKFLPDEGSKEYKDLMDYQDLVEKIQNAWWKDYIKRMRKFRILNLLGFLLFLLILVYIYFRYF